MYNPQGMKILSAVCNSLLLALPTIKTFSLALHVLTTRDNFHTIYTNNFTFQVFDKEF